MEQNTPLANVRHHITFSDLNRVYGDKGHTFCNYEDAVAHAATKEFGAIITRIINHDPLDVEMRSGRVGLAKKDAKTYTMCWLVTPKVN